MITRGTIRRRRFAPRRRRSAGTLVRSIRSSVRLALERPLRYAREAPARTARRLDPRAVAYRRKHAWRQLISFFTLRRLVLGLFGTAVAAFCVIGVVGFVKGEKWGPVLPWAQEQCTASGFGCNVVTQFLFTWAALAIGFWVFLFLRYTKVRRAYLSFAKSRPNELVETAGSIIGPVVGRDDLCDILQEDLQDPGNRQPHVLVGGLGIGKTAVLVQLTKLLAERGAVPIPIRLRDVKERIDFLQLARARFVEVLSYRLRSAQEADRVWNELRGDDRLVVLADGLEEAFADTEAYDRDHRVRVAISEAADQGFPLIIASRPHEALRSLEAAKVHLEPLSEEVALRYMEGDELEVDDPRHYWVVETAEVTETPLYLRIAGELNSEGLLEHLDTRGADRVPLRMALMKRWVEALIKGELHETEQVPLGERQRQAAVMHLEALACAGLRFDTQQVDLVKHWPVATPGVAAPRRLEEGEPPADWTDDLGVIARLRDYVEKEVEGLPTNDEDQTKELLDMEAAASRGIQLRLVDHSPNGVRFPHSIMQAYLASRVLGQALSERDDYAYLRLGLKNPGREFLLSLVMFARATNPGVDVAGQDERAKILESLYHAARGREPDGVTPRRVMLSETKRLDVLATGIEIAMAIEFQASKGKAAEGDLRTIDEANAMVDDWGKIKAADDAALNAKLNAVARLGDAARLLDRPELPARVEGEPFPREGLYECLYWICRQEDLYSVRLAAAQLIGKQGDKAWNELCDAFDTKGHVAEHTDKWGRVLAWDEPDKSRRGEYQDQAESGPTETTADWNPPTERRYALQGWLLPMMVRTIKDEGISREANAKLTQYVSLVGDEEMPLPLTLEAALAQGFKHAANLRPLHSHEQVEARAWLQHHATTMIHRAQFWYSRLTLLHALCLFEVARLELPGHAGHNQTDAPHDPLAVVERWLRRSGRSKPDSEGHTRPEREEDHPFVLTAADLVLEALRTGRPERYIWIDESGITSKIGSRSKKLRPHGKRRLWIPPSAGWIALDRRAQQLVADVLILLNLAERGDLARGRERRLWQTNHGKLPVCLTRERCPRLKPLQTVGMADIPDPGDDCVRTCRVELCPYPPRGQQTYRVELSEAFCRHQAALIRGPRPRAPWQEAPSRELRRFWSAMEERARK